MYLVRFSKQADKDKKMLKGAGLEKKAKELLNSTYYVLEASEIDNKKIRMNQGR